MSSNSPSHVWNDPSNTNSLSLEHLMENSDILSSTFSPLSFLKNYSKMKSNEDNKEDKCGGEKDITEWDELESTAAFLGPQLWDKTLPCDSNMKLEYMNLDELLNESDVESEVRKHNLTTYDGNSLSHQLSSDSLNDDPDLSKLADSLASSSSAKATTTTVKTSTRQATRRAKILASSSLHKLLQEESSCHSLERPESLLSSNSSVCSSQSITSDFDPKSRSFNEEDLKPLPVIKKSRKKYNLKNKIVGDELNCDPLQYVPSEMKDDRYWARRRKNNVAAKRSRDARRSKDNEIAMRANFLQKENDSLKEELKKSRELLEAMTKRLAVYES